MLDYRALANALDRLYQPVTPAAFPTKREGEVLPWFSLGKRNDEIAIILGISVRTVHKHFEHILAKLGVETRTAAAVSKGV